MEGIVVERPAATRDEWLNSIMNDGGQSAGINQMPGPKIQKVPQMLREIESNKKCYDPLVVSIGPYHHGKHELEVVEKQKIPMTRQYVLQSGRQIDYVYNKVVEVAENARKCYAEGSTGNFDDTAFARMMFLDGCFVLQFMHCIVENEREKMNLKSHIIAFMHRDMFLLENQLPFLVLETLMSLRFNDDKGKKMINTFIDRTRVFPPPGTSWKESLGKYIVEKIWGSQAQTEQKREDQPVVHLLELVRAKLIDPTAPTGRSYPSSSDWYSYRSAKELKTVGIHFKPSKTHLFTDVKYTPTLLSGVLKLPPITIDDSTKSMLLNLVAYETCPDAADDFGVTSYICFMDSLIDHAEDVKELRSRGILLNFQGSDQQVADLFNAIASDLVPNPNAYFDVRRRIEKHYKNKVNIWMTEWLHTHFSSPWTILAFIGAIFAISLSVMQTYLAANPPSH